MQKIIIGSGVLLLAACTSPKATTVVVGIDASASPTPTAPLGGEASPSPSESLSGDQIAEANAGNGVCNQPDGCVLPRSFSDAALQGLAGIKNVDLYALDGTIRDACDISWQVFVTIEKPQATVSEGLVRAATASHGGFNFRYYISYATGGDVEAVSTAMQCAQGFVGRTAG